MCGNGSENRSLFEKIGKTSRNRTQSLAQMAEQFHRSAIVTTINLPKLVLINHWLTWQNWLTYKSQLRRHVSIHQPTPMGSAGRQRSVALYIILLFFYQVQRENSHSQIWLAHSQMPLAHFHCFPEQRSARVARSVGKMQTDHGLTAFSTRADCRIFKTPSDHIILASRVLQKQNHIHNETYLF